MPSTFSNPRIVLCEACGSEGRVLRAEYSTDPNPRDCGPCPYCEGTGGEIIETQPIELDDLDEMCGDAAIQREIERLSLCAESGEQWAHICTLEARLVQQMEGDE